MNQQQHYKTLLMQQTYEAERANFVKTLENKRHTFKEIIAKQIVL